MIVDRINKYLTESNFPEMNEELLKSVGSDSAHMFDRQFGLKEERQGSIYLSSIGKCLRQQAYIKHNFERKGKEIDSRARMVFFQGDMAELAIIYLAKLAGVKIIDQQKIVQINGISGHPDGIVVIGEESVLLEVKSMSSFGFEKFEKGDIDKSYIYQINAYLLALGLKECVIVAMNKDSGVLGERVIKYDKKIANEIEDRIGILEDSTKDNLPEPEYDADEKGYLPWQCLYCSYWGICKPKAERVLVGKSYKLKEKK